MQQFEILSEIFHADTFIFMIIGIVGALLLSIKIPKIKIPNAFLIASGITVLCELLLKESTNYFAVFILLFIGTVSVGAVIGFIISGIIKGIRKKINS